MSIPNLLSIQIGKFRLSILEVIKGRMGKLLCPYSQQVASRDRGTLAREVSKLVLVWS